MPQGRITFLGTGTAFNHDGRGSQCLMIEPVGGSSFLVDAGPTMMGAMMRERIDITAIDRLFLTHLHGDHFAGWPFLLLHFVILQERRTPFDVYGPPGTRKCLEELAQLCYGEVFDRRRFDLRFHDLKVAHGSGLEVGSGLTLETWPMRHHASSIGLRFEVEGGTQPFSVAVSGDTGWCGGLERLASGSDLLALECTSLRREADLHLCLDEIREKFELLETERVVLTHLTDEVAENLAIDPIPGVIAAHDGMVVEFDGAA